MKKITGKVVSLVLALALVVSSFSANFAFASKRSVNGTLELDNDDHDVLYLVNSDANDPETKDNMKVKDLLGYMNPELDTKDHEDLDDDVKITAISHVSGDSLMKWNINESPET